MDDSFAVTGQLLGALHLLECEGAEFKSDIRVVMKRRKEDGVKRQVSNKQEYFLGSQ
jgi:hypothetical protein